MLKPWAKGHQRLSTRSWARPGRARPWGCGVGRRMSPDVSSLDRPCRRFSTVRPAAWRAARRHRCRRRRTSTPDSWAQVLGAAWPYEPWPTMPTFWPDEEIGVLVVNFRVGPFGSSARRRDRRRHRDAPGGGTKMGTQMPGAIAARPSPVTPVRTVSTMGRGRGADGSRSTALLVAVISTVRGAPRLTSMMRPRRPCRAR